MYIENLDLETRNKIYNHTKKILRKYQKGIINGKITADKFAENILSNSSLENILDKEIISTSNFKKSYVDYIQALINIQNNNLSNKRFNSNQEKTSISQKIELKTLLNNKNFNLSIPIDYLNSDDINCIIKYLETDKIELGNERIYNYVRKIN